MPLVVPLLRLAMVFLNVYDSFKTLKPPPVSSRNGSRLSLRGKTQRKRDMKGCLAVWIVWCCFVSYERFFERIVSLFIPFYDEMKSLVLLFLIFTRARGAEPIYLHVIRPMLKPYTATLDICLDVTCMIGDMLLTLFIMPIRPFMSWWHHYFGHDARDSSVGGRSTRVAESTPSFGAVPALQSPSRSTNGQAASSNQILRPIPSRHSSRSHIVSNTNRPPETRRYPASQLMRGNGRVRPQASDASQSSISRPPNPLRTVSQPQPRSPSQRQLSGSVSEPQPEVWIPPASYQDSEEVLVPAPAATPQAPSLLSSTPSAVSGLPKTVQDQVEDWRMYPPLPAAYPPTPLVITAQLGARADKERAATEDLSIPNTVEESDMQNFDQPLPLPVSHSSSQQGLGNEEYSLAESAPALDEDMDSDADDSDLEDEFNTTMRTPRAPRRNRVYNEDHEIASPASSSSSSIQTRSTTLDTIENASSLRTGTTSESDAMSLSDSSMAGQKRLRPRSELKVPCKNQASIKTITKGTNGRSTIRAKPHVSADLVRKSQQQILRSMSISAASDDDLDGDAPTPAPSSMGPATKSKRRKVNLAHVPSTVNGTRTSRAAAKSRDGTTTANRNVRSDTSGKPKTSGRTRAIKRPPVSQTRPVQSAEVTNERDGSQQFSQRSLRR